MTEAGRAVADERFGHPRGLLVLSFTELWERFSYYGMMGLLTLYMTDQLFKPGHIEHVLGFGSFRALVEGAFGPLTPVALASQIFGLYTGLVYVTPILGGLIGDQVLGQRRTVVLGVVLMAAGHLAMTSEALFLVALTLLIVGAGCIKGNMAAQVGRLYAVEDTRRTRAFAIYLVALNVGAFTAPLVCGTLGERYGWHYGFAAAGFGMLVALATYLLGQKHLPPDAVRRGQSGHVAHPRLHRGEGKVLAALVLLLIPYVLVFSAYQQCWNIFLLWGHTRIDLDLGGFRMPVTWYATIDGVLTIVALAVIVRLWRWQAERRRELGDLANVAIGAALMTGAFAVLAAATGAAGQGLVAFAPTVLFFVLADFAIPFVDTVTMALFSRRAPTAVNTTMIGVYYLGSAGANITTGWLGRFYETLPTAQFWWLHAAVAASGVGFVVLFGRVLGRWLKAGRADAEPSRPTLTAEPI